MLRSLPKRVREAKLALLVPCVMAAPALQLWRRLRADADADEQRRLTDDVLGGGTEATSIVGVLLCLTSASLAAGLTMGTVSLDKLDLQLKIRTGSEEDRLNAEKLLPLLQRKPHHQLLVTLLLFNSLANEALPIFLEVSSSLHPSI